MMPDLVCEGACSPNLPLVERDVATYRKRYLRDGTVYPIEDGLALRLRAASKHTPHAYVRPEHYRCEVCGHLRRWGGNYGFSLAPIAGVGV
jgi:hypothetical protein